MTTPLRGSPSTHQTMAMAIPHHPIRRRIAITPIQNSHTMTLPLNRHISQLLPQNQTHPKTKEKAISEIIRQPEHLATPTTPILRRRLHHTSKQLIAPTQDHQDPEETGWGMPIFLPQVL
jgi:hypothetical protein